MQLQLVHQHGSVRLLIIKGVVDSLLVQSETVQDPVLQLAPGFQYFQRPFNALQRIVLHHADGHRILDEAALKNHDNRFMQRLLCKCLPPLGDKSPVEAQRELVNILLGQGMIFRSSGKEVPYSFFSFW